jgi:hypothetical protein
VSFYVSTATFFLLHCDEWDRVVALPRHKFVTGATLLQLDHDHPHPPPSCFFEHFYLKDMESCDNDKSLNISKLYMKKEICKKGTN